MLKSDGPLRRFDTLHPLVQISVRSHESIVPDNPVYGCGCQKRLSSDPAVVRLCEFHRGMEYGLSAGI